MSYYTHVTFDFSDFPPPAEVVSPVVRAWLMKKKNYAAEDVLEDFLRGWTESETDFNKLDWEDIEELMKHVSAQYPTIRFYVRGMGEEFGDVWLRAFERGAILYHVGPFDGPDE